MKGYPVFLIGLDKKRCVVIGETHEAERKIAGLLDCDADVTVIGRRLPGQALRWVEEGRIRWIRRGYQPGDLADAFLVIAENRHPDDNAAIYAEAREAGALVNVMDDIEHCRFIAGSVLRQGPLTVAISTNGAAPTLAVRLRERLEQDLGPEYATFLNLMQALREPLARHIPELNARRALWYELVDSDILDLLREGKSAQALTRIAEIVEDAAPAAEHIEEIANQIQAGAPSR